jgi:hypothetical protein
LKKFEPSKYWNYETLSFIIILKVCSFESLTKIWNFETLVFSNSWIEKIESLKHSNYETLSFKTFNVQFFGILTKIETVTVQSFQTLKFRQNLNFWNMELIKYQTLQNFESLIISNFNAETMRIWNLETSALT